MTDAAPTSNQLELMTPNGLVLRGARHLPAGDPRAAIAIAHGKDEHQGRYGHVVNALTEHGYAVYTIDHRNHGLSDGERGHMERFDDYVEDFDLLVGSAERELPGTPIVLLGHSMGGLIALRYALRAQARLAGMILSGPALLIGENDPAWKKRVFLMVGRFLPGIEFPTSEPGLLSRDPEVERAFAEDPNCYNGPTLVGFARNLYLASEESRKHFADIRLPLLLMHGSDDKLTSPGGTEQLYREAASTDKTLKIWEGDRHEIFNEPEGPDVIAYMAAWLDARFPSQHASVQASIVE